MDDDQPFIGDGSLHCALAAGVHSRAFEGELILLDSRSGDYFALNAIGLQLVQALEDGYSLEECARQLHRAFDVDWPRLCFDVSQLSMELLSRNLLVPRNMNPAIPEASS